MTMRHKPIRPKQYAGPKYTRRDNKPQQAQTIYLTPEQQAALTQFQKDFQKTLPVIEETQAVAQRIFQELIDAPRWRIAETQMPNGISQPEQKMWTVGHAKVNIIDEREGQE